MYFQALKFMIDAALLHDCVGDMPRLNFHGYREILLGNRAMPNIMIALAAPHK
jgi:hypothetical protein